MDLKNTQANPNIRIGILVGSALLLLTAILIFTRMQGDKQTVNSNQTPLPNNRVLSRIGLVQAHNTWSARTAIFLDLRPNSAFARTHIPGAISIPVEEIESRYEELPDDQMIISYADDPLEETSEVAVQFLINQGFTNTTILSGGIEGWIQYGYPIDP